VLVDGRPDDRGVLAGIGQPWEAGYAPLPWSLWDGQLAER